MNKNFPLFTRSEKLLSPRANKEQTETLKKTRKRYGVRKSVPPGAKKRSIEGRR
jgi:hypothetical protein